MVPDPTNIVLFYTRLCYLTRALGEKSFAFPPKLFSLGFPHSLLKIYFCQHLSPLQFIKDKNKKKPKYF